MNQTAEHEVADIAAMDGNALREKYRHLLGTEPGGLSETFMRQRMSFLVQSLRTGVSLTPTERGLLETIAKRDPALNPSARPLPKAKTYRNGKTWSRVYKGVKHVVTVDAFGRYVYQQDGQTYSSPTAIARMITGTHCSGRKFFGIEA